MDYLLYLIRYRELHVFCDQNIIYINIYDSIILCMFMFWVMDDLMNSTGKNIICSGKGWDF